MGSRTSLICLSDIAAANNRAILAELMHQINTDANDFEEKRLKHSENMICVVAVLCDPRYDSYKETEHCDVFVQFRKPCLSLENPG